ncbi:MAG: valine--tRNA ligase [Verrucomicrobiia bacterium]
MSSLSTAYEPKHVEEKWYADWLKENYFHADPHSSKSAFSIVIPPPNVTGVLTMGHVLNNTIQDILCRKARMEGKEVLWLPGTDHAGIATQTVVERELKKTEKKTRRDLGREEFLKRVWNWKEKHGGIIIQQLKKLGCSCDWERERFTMDEAYSCRVAEVFIDLYQKGLIYRGKRMVNWCPISLTALSDEEVIPKPQQSTLYYVKYEIVEKPGTFLEIATTRPETIMGDTAVAVNPEDPRYKNFIGLHCRRPLPEEKQEAISIIGDSHIDKEFGTGVLKVTPAHDKADFEIGQRHQLSIIDIMNPNGSMNVLAGKDFQNLDRFEARKLAVEKLKNFGLLIREEPYQNNVGFSERADVPIEPRLSEQWFLKYPKTQEARDAVRKHLIRFFPERWEKVYDHWLENIQDWCISRQLWWGHRIPVWYHKKNLSEIKVSLTSPGEDWEQDSDVLDTWFSSWLWPFDTMDEKTLAKFYPTSVLVTGPDIIFFWVARMIMAGLEYKNEIPFHDVYFTGIIRDKQGRKMSKSLGNSPDPLDLISKYGADGLRFGLMRIAPQGQDIRFDETQIVEGRNFCNKLWNACRFRLLQGSIDPQADPSKHELTLFTQDLLAKLNDTLTKMNCAFAGYHFNEMAQTLYDFVWGDFCDWFLEVAKAEFNSSSNESRKQATLATIDYTLSHILRLLHPLTPFITEELWHELGFDQGTIQFANWPQASSHFSSEPKAEMIYQSVSKARTLRTHYNIASNKKVRWLLQIKEPWIQNELHVIQTLLNAQTLELITVENASPMCLTDIGNFHLPLEGLIDRETEKARFTKELEKAKKDWDQTQTKLNNPSFAEKVPSSVLQEHQERAKKLEEKIDQLQTQLKNLDNLSWL